MRRGRMVGRRAVLFAAALLAACAGPTLSGPRGPGQAPESQVPAGPPGNILNAGGGGGAVEIGLLVPLSGDSAAIGSAMERAARMALDDIGAGGVRLIVQDAGADPLQARFAAEQAIAQGADVILGPLFASAVPGAADAARAAGINLISFSTDRRIAGGNTLVMGFVSRDQIGRVVAYGASRGIRSVAMMGQQSEYAQIVAEDLRDAAAAHGVTVGQISLYSGMSPIEETRAIAEGGYGAILLTDVGQNLRVVAPMLDYYRSGSQLYGTGRWEDPATAQEPTVRGGWYAAPDPTRWNSFRTRMEAVTGTTPPRLASLAYDGAALVAALARARPMPAALSWESLTDPSGFVGVDGLFRFSPDGVVERGLAVLQVTQDGPQVIAPAPQSFAGVGF